MTEAGIWTSRRERKRRLHQPHGQRDCLGELVQIDGSHHWWFEHRGAKCALLVFIDDATGKLLHLRFAGTRTRSTTSIRPGRICGNGASRWLSIATSTASSERPTVLSRTPTSGLAQFGRALYELNIDIICANTPQVKGRVERANQTLQDGLVASAAFRVCQPTQRRPTAQPARAPSAREYIRVMSQPARVGSNAVNSNPLMPLATRTASANRHTRTVTLAHGPQKATL